MIAARVWRALAARPSARDLAEFSLALALFAVAAAAVGQIGGLARWSPKPPAEVLPLAVGALFIPALGEELVFRAALVPTRGTSANPAAWIVASTLLFALWHVAETTFLPGAGGIFLRADFLALAVWLGVLCALLRFRSGSIWTAVALHWLVVVAWLGWFGGPAFGPLR